jgi:hypothetical protein
MRKKGTTTEWTTKLIGQVVELRGKEKANDKSRSNIPTEKSA